MLFFLKLFLAVFSSCSQLFSKAVPSCFQNTVPKVMLENRSLCSECNRFASFPCPALPPHCFLSCVLRQTDRESELSQSLHLLTLLLTVANSVANSVAKSVSDSIANYVANFVAYSDSNLNVLCHPLSDEGK